MIEDLEGEIWKDIIGYEGIYQISNKSRFKSLSRKIQIRKNVYKTITEKIINKRLNSNKYLVINLKKDNILNTYLTHRLVAINFIPNPNNLLIVEHKDDNKLNDYVDNLMWSTSCNNNYNSCYRLKKSIKSILQYTLNGEFVAEHNSIANAQRLFTPNSNTGSIANHLIGKSKHAYGYIWKYKL